MLSGSFNLVEVDDTKFLKNLPRYQSNAISCIVQSFDSQTLCFGDLVESQPMSI